MPQSSGSVLPGMFRATKDAITATPSGTATNSEELVNGINRVSASASNDDGLLLPLAEPGANVVVYNDDAAQDVEVFAREDHTLFDGSVADDNINGVASVHIGEGVVGYFDCLTQGTWQCHIVTMTKPVA